MTSGLDPVNLALDPAWAAGFVLATARVAAFVVASPILGRAVPTVGRIGLVLALALFLAHPVPAAADLGPMLGAVLVNVAVGVVLGFLTGVVFHLFAVAGSLVDLTSGLSVAILYDPGRGEQAAIFSRMFNLVALTLFIVGGGLRMLVRGLAASVAAVPLDGAVAPHAGLVELTLHLIGTMTVAALELALPVLAALFLAEIVLGLASRLAPQANVLLIGLPAKLLVAFSVLSVTLLLFPGAMDGLFGDVGDAFESGLRALGA